MHTGWVNSISVYRLSLLYRLGGACMVYGGPHNILGSINKLCDLNMQGETCEYVCLSYLLSHACMLCVLVLIRE